MRLRFAIVLALGVVSAFGCTVHQSADPGTSPSALPQTGISGPSEFGLSLSITTLPDTLTLDGASTARIEVKMFQSYADGHTAPPAPGTGVVRLDIAVNGTFQDCGTLSARSLVADSTGTVTATYTAPGLPLPYPQCAGFAPGNVVTIIATPSQNNFDTVNNFRTASIRLVPNGVIVPPADTPTAKFTFTPTVPSANSPVVFDASTSCPGPLNSAGTSCASSTSAITSYAWDFGDGGTASGINATHNFKLQQSYRVTLTVTNDRGVASSTTQSVAVGVGSVPTASFVFSPTPAVVNGIVNFDATASRPGAGHQLANYSWNFGDGDTKTGSDKAITTHDFLTAGTFTVLLTVTDEAGQQGTTTQTVTVGTGSPVPVITFSPTSPKPGNQVSFSGSSSTTSGGATITSYAWDFGDPTSGSNSSSAATPTHTYATGAVYTVRLTVTDSQGRSGTATITVTVS